MADEHKHTVKKHLGLVIRVGIAILACWWVVREMDFNKVSEASEAFKKPSNWVWATVIGVFIFSQILLALRWWLFMRAWDIYVDFWSTIKLAFLGLYFNNCLPGSVGGDLVRAWYVAQHTSRRMASVISVFVDRALALLGTVLIALTAFWAAGKEEIFTRQNESRISTISSEIQLAILIITSLFVVIIAGIFIVPSGHKLLKSIFEKGLWYGKNAISQSFQAGLVLIRKPFLLIESLSLTFILQGMVVLSLWILGRQMGIPAEWKLYFVFFPLIWVIGSIPISIAGIGIVEGGLIFLLQHFGNASYGAALALALSQRAVWLIASLPGLVIYLSGKHLPANFDHEFSVDEKQTMQ